MRHLNSRLSLTLLALLFLPFPTPAQSQFFQLLTPTTGWFLAAHRLFYTTDSGAHWSDISPVQPFQIRVDKLGTVAVHFRGPVNAWALIAVPDLGPSPNCDENFSFDLASTTDAGTHWSRHTIPITEFYPNGACRTFNGRGEIFFLDSNHGWIDLPTGTAGMPSSIVLYTTDGGISWHTSDNQDCGAGLLFTTARDGWSVSEIPEIFCVTHDGGATFTETTITPPQEIAAAYPDRFSYASPIFQDPNHGFEIVSYTKINLSRAAMILYETRDAGRTWKPIRTLVGPTTGDFIPASVAGSTLITGYRSSRHTLRLIEVPTHGFEQPTMDSSSGGWDLSFINESNGWVLLYGVGLISTHDAGQTWTNITLPDTQFGFLPRGNWAE